MPGIDAGIVAGIIKEEIRTLVEEFGCELVEVKLGRTKNLDDITLIIHKNTGVSLMDCGEISRAVAPRLEMLEEFEHIALKVSSPGVDRVIKSSDEYRIFKGKGVKILLMNTTEWLGGIIDEVAGNKLKLRQQDKMIDININSIKKAKLDFTEEVGK